MLGILGGLGAAEYMEGKTSNEKNYLKKKQKITAVVFYTPKEVNF